MNSHCRVDRRRFLVLSTGLAAGAPALLGATPEVAIQPEEGVTAPEDLMREHGVLNRCLLVYEAGISRIRQKQEVPPAAFLHTAQLIRQFVEDYHEKNEENYIFPLFVRAKKMEDIITVLLQQHQAGRRLTTEIMNLCNGTAFNAPANREKLVTYCDAFIRMYRPHEAREDTVIFPALRTIIPAARVKSIGTRMEADEQRVLGNEGFEKCVDRVATIEKQLGIYNLAEFTPKI